MSSTDFPPLADPQHEAAAALLALGNSPSQCAKTLAIPLRDARRILRRREVIARANTLCQDAGEAARVILLGRVEECASMLVTLATSLESASHPGAATARRAALDVLTLAGVTPRQDAATATPTLSSAQVWERIRAILAVAIPISPDVPPGVGGVTPRGRLAGTDDTPPRPTPVPEIEIEPNPPQDVVLVEVERRLFGKR